MAKTVNCHCVTVTSPLYLYPVPRWLKYTKWLGRRQAPVLPIPRPAQPAPPPQPDHPLPHDQEDDSFRIVRGRTKNSENCLYRGYRYSKDGKPSSRTGKQAWRCVLRSNGGCKGRLHSLDGTLLLPGTFVGGPYCH